MTTGKEEIRKRILNKYAAAFQMLKVMKRGESMKKKKNKRS